MAVVIVGRTLFGVGEDGVRLVDLLALRLRVLVVGVHIGVILFGELSVRLFYRIVISAALNAQHFIIISFISHCKHLSKNALNGMGEKRPFR